MSEKSKLRAKAQFRVLFRLTRINGSEMHDAWRDRFGRTFTYMSASEEVNQLRGTEGLLRLQNGTIAEYEYKTVYDKVWKMNKETR